MLNRFVSVPLCGIVFLTSLAVAESKISGDYMETRSADVYTGQCFANGEVGLVGDQALLAWHVRSGSWNGVKLDGLSVVAAVKANATLGDPYADPYPAKAVLIVDQQAKPAERAALADFARHMGGKLLANVVKTEFAPIDMEVVHHGAAQLRAGSFATIQTRTIGENDHLCGNEDTFYPPLTTVAHAMPAVAVTDQFSGSGLGNTWTLHDKRSAFVGTF